MTKPNVQLSLSPLYAIIFVGFFGYALTVALFVPLLMDPHSSLVSTSSSKETRAVISGILLAMYPLGQFIGAPIIGHLSDHYGRKYILQTSLILSTAGFIVMGLAIYEQQIILLFVSCLFTGLCESNMAISQSSIADISSNEKQKIKLIGYAYAAASLGFTLSPMFVALIIKPLGFSAPFFITAAGTCLVAIWLKIKLKDCFQPHKTTDEKRLNPLYAIKTLISQRQLRRIYSINFAIFFAVQGLYRIMPIYIVNTWHPTVVTYTLIIAYVSSLCLIANFFFTSRLAKSFTAHKLLIALNLFGGIAVLLIVLPENFSSIWITYGFAVIPTVMTLAISTSWLSGHANSADQGQVMGNNQALLVLGEASSAVVGGFLSAMNTALPIIMMGVILLCAAYWVWRTPQ